MQSRLNVYVLHAIQRIFSKPFWPIASLFAKSNEVVQLPINAELDITSFV